ncbi:MAG: alpha/beta fold hydrolase [Gammaproteobacteria bacterium]
MTTPKPCVIPFVCCVIAAALCSGCAHPHRVTKAFDLWGEPHYLTAEGEAPRHLQWLEPAPGVDAAGCLLMVHGMNEHSGRYGDIARHFADRYIVAAVDLSTHGLSNPVLKAADSAVKSGASAYDAGDAYLEQAELGDLQSMFDDLDIALEYLAAHCGRRANGDPRPLFILSHSLGSLVSASYLLDMKDAALKSRIDGIVFSGPAFAVTEVPGWRGWFQNPLIWFTFHTHEHFLNPHDEALPLMLLNQLVALVTVPLQDGIVEFASLPGLNTLFSATGPSWVGDHLSDSREELIRLSQDQYLVRRCVLRFVLAVEKEIIRFRQRMDRFDVPYLLIYSEQDPITPAWGNVDFAAATRQKSPANELMVLTGKSHHEQLFSGPKLRTRILAKIDAWFEQRLNKPVIASRP